MNNPILNSQAFEQAAYSLRSEIERMNNSVEFAVNVDRYVQATATFEASVNKLATILGMQAENDQRKAVGSSMAYTEDDFAKA